MNETGTRPKQISTKGRGFLSMIRLSIATRVDIPQGTIEKAAEIYFQLAENKRDFDNGILRQEGLTQSRLARLAHISEKEARKALRLIELLVSRAHGGHGNTVSLSHPPGAWTGSRKATLEGIRGFASTYMYPENNAWCVTHGAVGCPVCCPNHFKAMITGVRPLPKPSQGIMMELTRNDGTVLISSYDTAAFDARRVVHHARRKLRSEP
jgi:hypothetical protein